MNSPMNISLATGILWVFLSIASLSASSPVFATEAVFQGTLTEESVDKFIQQNEEKPITLLRIHSGGGVVFAGVKLGRWVRQKNVDVQVDGFCVSACANYVFPAGRNKIISPGALVLWHGHMKHKEIQEMQDQFRKLIVKASAPDADFSVTKAVADGKGRYEKIEQQIAIEAEFFSEMGIDGALFLLGYEPVKYDTEYWCATVDVMKKFGISAVTASAGYGTVDYINKSIFAKLFFKDARLTFVLGPDGQVIATPVGKNAK